MAIWREKSDGVLSLGGFNNNQKKKNMNNDNSNYDKRNVEI